MKKLSILLVVLLVLLGLWQVNLVSGCEEPPPTGDPGSITAHKFDADDGGDIAGWGIRLYFLDGTGTQLVAEGTTASDGTVTFTDVPPGLYKVWEEKRECWTPVTPPGMNQWEGGYYTVVDLGEGQQISVEFGNSYGCATPPETCIDLEKTGPETAVPGETITYHFWVKNCGDIILKGGAQVHEALFGDDPIWSGDLEPGKVVEFDKAYTLPGDYCGDFTNNAWAVGYPPGYPEVRDDDSWTVAVSCGPEPNPSIDVEKYVSVDDQVTWHDADTPPGQTRTPQPPGQTRTPQPPGQTKTPILPTETVSPTGTPVPLTATVTMAPSTATPEGLVCVCGLGYWKTHSNVWPVNSLTLGNETYTQAELLDLLNEPTRGDASLILAKQLIAAELNVANGADDSAVAVTIAIANAWLTDYIGKLPYHVSPDLPEGQEAIALADALEQYNNGALPGGPPECP